MSIRKQTSSARSLRFKWRDLINRIHTLPQKFIKRSQAGKKYLAMPIPTRQQLVRGALVILGILIIAIIGFQLYRYFGPHNYRLSSVEAIIGKGSDFLAQSLKYDDKKNSFIFTHGSSQTIETKQTGATLVSASMPVEASKGMTVTDPNYKIDVTMKPIATLSIGKQDKNRVIYPFRDHNGWLVYTATSIGIKEDIVLTQKPGDHYRLDYELKLPSGTEARQESDGSIGIYGNQIFMNNVTTATDADTSLLEKAKANAEKNLLLFVIPSPTVVESGKQTSNVSAKFTLNANRLTVTATGLEKASYPLSIDPSIYIVTAQQFMNGNNETNIDFDTANKLIKKAATTGARFDSWQPTMNMNTSAWKQGVATAGGYMYTVGGVHPEGGKVTYTTAGNDIFTVPSGITSITVKAWGAGGGGGGGGNASAGGAGGGGGYSTSTINVTPNESLNIIVGGGGGGGSGSTTSGGGGGGGGYSGVKRGSSSLTIAAGGAGGGGGGQNSGNTGGAGGGGGGTTGSNGSASGTSGGGGGGTATSGGSGGTGTVNNGSAGSAFQGGAGGDGRNTQGGDGGANNGGISGGGDGGARNVSNRYAGAGGGGGGYYGGGGGTGSTNRTGAGGGGGGSSYTTGSDTSTDTATGSNAGNSTDTDRVSAGDGGAAGAARNTGAAGENGIVVITYVSDTGAINTVAWARFNDTDGSIESTNPGNGVCSGWCTSAQYNLPSPRGKLSLVAYNGFLFALGGEDTSCTTANGTGDNGICKTVYIAKLGANGEPQLWHPTDGNKSNWAYWYRATDLSSPRSAIRAVAYNNRIYLTGGITSSGGALSVVSSTEIADVIPNGTLGTWSSSVSLPSALYGHSSQVYNDRLYLIGGANSIGGSPLSNVYYSKINPDGSLNSWVATTSLETGRMSSGGDFATIWGAYIYTSGGCTATNASGYCTAVADDSDVASINADGSLDAWNGVGGVASARTGHSLTAWRGYVYIVGGCSSQNITNGTCNNALDSIQRGKINQDGDASTVGQSVPNGTAPCNGTSQADCNLPGTAYIGNMLTVSFISNGYLYLIGGCTNNGCSSTSSNTAYVAISSTGHMTKPANCPSPRTIQGGMWCVDTTNTTPGGTAASSPVVFNGRVYLVGGLSGSANTNALLRANINQADGSLSAWSSQSLTGLGVNNVSYSYAFARANPSDVTTNPGNLYLFGGCLSSSGAGCTAYSQNVYKCNIQSAGAISGCSTSGQLQIGTIPGDTQSGLGIMSGAVYANYVYLIGGVSPNLVDLDTIRYAKIDSNNNIVAVSGSSWIESAYKMAVGRRRSAAFGYNGYLYAVGGYEANSGVLADIEFIKINVSDGSLVEGWKVSAVEINQRWGLAVAVSNSYAYVIGGCTVGSSPSGCTTRTDIVQTFQIYNNDSGAPAGYTSSSTLPAAPNRVGASATILNGYVYLAGGCTSPTDCTNAISDVSYAPINANGNIGTWTSITSNGLPQLRAWGKLLAAGGTLYYIGGQDSAGTEQSTIYHTTPAADGTLPALWATTTSQLPSSRSKFGAASWNNRLYVVGGQGSGTGCTASRVCSNIYVSPQMNGGGNITGAWSTASANLPVARSGVAAVAYANNLYAFGGFDGVNYLSDTQYSKIDSVTGNTGNWTYSTSLPKPLADADAVAANGYIYLVGGRDTATTCAPSTMIAPVNANTTIASGNNPTGVGEWSSTNQRFSGNRYGAAAAYSDGKLYVIGGGCGATLTYPAIPDTVQQTTLLSQPQVAKYSIMIDTDTDVFPKYWLLNGLDNSIGARWQLKYRSMANQQTVNKCATMTTWGQETRFGEVTLGTPGAYIVKDASGADIKCGRYYYFNVTVDSSQAFGYPDDVSRGPTITDLSLFFTADPSKRLMHGRTFTGGLQQPLDTPANAN